MQERAEPRSGLTEAEIRRRLAEIAQCRVTGQWDRMMEYFSANLIVRYNYSSDRHHLNNLLFSPQIVEGRNAFRTNLERINQQYEPLDCEILDVLVEGEKGAIRWRASWRERGTGAVHLLEMAHFARWRNDAIVELSAFLEMAGGPFTGPRPLTNLEAMLHPPAPGLKREEMVARVKALANYPTPYGPDVALLRRYYSPDIVCEFAGDRARIPYAGRHVGVEAVLNIVRGIGMEFEQLGYSLSDILVDGGRLACRRTVEWRHRGTGRRGIVELAEFLKFENGLIVELIEYRDSLTILEMQGELEVW